MFSVHLPFICHKMQESASKHCKLRWRIQTIRYGGGGGHPDTEIRGGGAPVSKINFFGPSGLILGKKKNKGRGPPQAPSLDPPLN